MYLADLKAKGHLKVFLINLWKSTVFWTWYTTLILWVFQLCNFMGSEEGRKKWWALELSWVFLIILRSIETPDVHMHMFGCPASMEKSDKIISSKKGLFWKVWGIGFKIMPIVTYAHGMTKNRISFWETNASIAIIALALAVTNGTLLPCSLLHTLLVKLGITRKGLGIFLPTSPPLLLESPLLEIMDIRWVSQFSKLVQIQASSFTGQWGRWRCLNKKQHPQIIVTTLAAPS